MAYWRSGRSSRSSRQELAHRIAEVARHVRHPLQELPDLGNVIRAKPHDKRQPDEPCGGVPKGEWPRLAGGPDLRGANRPDHDLIEHEQYQDEAPRRNVRRRVPTEYVPCI